MHEMRIRESARRLIAAIGDEAIRATAQPDICGVDRGVDLVLGWHDGPATQAAKAYAAIETVCAARAGELIAEHGLDELVNKKHEGGGVIYGLRVVKLIERLDELESLEKTGRMQPFVLLYVGQTVCVLVRRRQHATMENKPPSLTAVACACFRGHIDDRDIDIDVLGVVDNVVAHRLGLGDDVDMKTLMNAAEFAFFASSSASTALTNRVPAGYEGAFMASARGDGGGGGGDEDDDDVPHVRDPCHHPMCVVCNQRHSSYGPADGPRRRCATCRLPEDKCKNFSSLCSLCLEEGVTTHASYGPVGGTRERCMKHKKHDDEKKK
ncbi:hypothetical protein NFJ02_24g55630 [Pycnococcus provasolii]